MADIGKERFKGSAPTLAHLNPTSTVIMKVLVFWVMTTLLHLRPNPVFGGLPHPVDRSINADTTARFTESSSD